MARYGKPRAAIGARRVRVAPLRRPGGIGVVAATLTFLPFVALVSGTAVAGPAGAVGAARLTGAAGAAAAPGSRVRPSMVGVTAAPSIPAGARAAGAVSASAHEAGALVLQPRDAAALSSFVASVTDKQSPMFGHYLPVGQFAARFGPSTATILKVEAVLASEGLTVTSVSGDGLLVNFAGSARTIERAFRTGLESYRLADGAPGQATTSAVEVPSTIAKVVSSVVGLDDLVHEVSGVERSPISQRGRWTKAASPRFSHPSGSPTACAAATSDAEDSGGLTDDAIANSYGAFGLYSAGDAGAGQHVAVYELEPFVPADISTFDKCYFGSQASSVFSRLSSMYSPENDSALAIDGGEPPGFGSGESVLDIEDVSAIAPGAKIDVYEAPNNSYGGIDEYASIIDADVDKIVTSSWGLCEQAVQLGEPGTQQAENLLFEQAAAQGQTIFSAAGDTGDDTCNEQRLPVPPNDQNFLSVMDPASNPDVVAVGGTTIDDATQPPLEHVWNDGANWGSGGGGVSMSWAMPTWQRRLIESSPTMLDEDHSGVSAGEAIEKLWAAAEGDSATPTFCAPSGTAVSATFCRELPDVSALADEFTGAVTVFSASFLGDSPDGWITIGGTSSATPIWAALTALIDASKTCNGTGVGFLAPVLYGVAGNPNAYAASFNDIKLGNNDVYGLDNGAVFPAGAAYDMASGLGTPALTRPGGNHDGLAFYACSFATHSTRPTVVSVRATVTGSSAIAVSGGNRTITITGSGFEAGGSPDVSSIEIGAGQATGITVSSATSITATAPDATLPLGSGNPQNGAGPANVVVTLDSDESSRMGPGSVLQYVAATGSPNTPSVAGVFPYGGPQVTPKPVTVYGSGFGTCSNGAGSCATGFAPDVSSVNFGGVAGSGVTVESPDELTVTPPAYTSLTPVKACINEATIDPATDVCQVQVVVTTKSGSTTRSSGTNKILPPYEGPLAFDAMGITEVPPGVDAEQTPAPTEYDYVPAPSVTSVSTEDGNPADLAGEFGGSEILIKGTGFDPLTLDWLNIGGSPYINAVQVTGAEIVLSAPAVINANAVQPQPGPEVLPFTVQTLAGTSAPSGKSVITYAGVPTVSAVVNESKGARDLSGLYGAPDDAPTPIVIDGKGLDEAIGVEYLDKFSPFSVGTQYSFKASGSTALRTETVAQNPAIVDVSVCTVTSCSFDPVADAMVLYVPGNPSVASVSVKSGPAHGGTKVLLSGSNLGCAIGVAFGSAQATQFTNALAFLDCGLTNTLSVVTPPAVASPRAVPIEVLTFECFFSGCTPRSSASFTFIKSSPSAPSPITVHGGAATASVSWRPPMSDAGYALRSYTVTATSPGRTPVTAAGLPVSHLDYTFKALQPGVPWTFSVSAANAAGTGPPAKSSPATTLSPGGNGYLIGTANGAVFGFGSLSSDGGVGGQRLPAPIVGIAAAPNGLGYYEVASNGSVYHFGLANFYGSASVGKGQRVVAMATTPGGHGYWLVSNTGSVSSFGDAKFHGAPSKTTDVVGIASTPDGNGYWMTESNGGVQAFGDARLHGSMAGKHLNKPIVGIVSDPVLGGYWLIGGDGGVFSFAVPYFGSMIGKHLNEGATGMVPVPDGHGYWIVAADGGVFTFGAATYEGNALKVEEASAVGVAAAP